MERDAGLEQHRGGKLMMNLITRASLLAIVLGLMGCAAETTTDDPPADDDESEEIDPKAPVVPAAPKLEIERIGVGGSPPPPPPTG